jgi:hypothetical protein
MDSDKEIAESVKKVIRLFRDELNLVIILMFTWSVVLVVSSNWGFGILFFLLTIALVKRVYFWK